jgi:hypothetical protein
MVVPQVAYVSGSDGAEGGWIVLLTGQTCRRLNRYPTAFDVMVALGSIAQSGQQVPPPEPTTMLANCSLSPVLTYHSHRAPSGPASQVSVFWA